MDKSDHYSRKGKYGHHSSNTLRIDIYSNKDKGDHVGKKETTFLDDEHPVFVTHGFYVKNQKNHVVINGEIQTIPKQKTVNVAKEFLKEHEDKPTNGKTISRKSKKRHKSRLENAKKVVEFNNFLEQPNIVYSIPEVPREKYFQEKVKRNFDRFVKEDDCGQKMRKNNSKNLSKIICNELFSLQ